MSEKLQNIRKSMAEHNLAAYLVPHNDSHMSEYIAARDGRIQFISGFSGSAGICLITQDIAYLWTDGRYWLQAGNQLEEGWDLMKSGQSDTPTWFKWAKQHLSGGDIIGFDPYLIPQGTVETRKTFFEESKIEFNPVETNLVDQVWGEAQPEWSSDNVSLHEETFHGRSVSQNIKEVMEKVEENKGESILISSLDEIAWLTNLRGQDIMYNPVFFSYVVIYKKDDTYQIRLYIDENKTKHIPDYLSQNNIETAPYQQVFEDLSHGAYKNVKIVLDKNSCNHKVYSSIDPENIVNAADLVGEIKFVKNETQIKGFRASQIRDGAAVLKFFAWLENELCQNGAKISEYEGSLQLEKFRAQQALYMGLSFGTILSSGANGAIIHYKPEKDKSAQLNPTEMILCDSGGHYLDGTTDTTRTVHYTDPTSFQKEMYTRVLKGNLDMERVKIPNKNRYSRRDIDVLARRPLWEVGLNYNHSTGHGVGHYLNVHEGPRDKTWRPGMTYTDEPGYYKDGEFGIRIENLLILHKDPEIEEYMCFENVTKVPYCRNLIDTDYLSPKDVEYINKYHEEVKELLSPLLQDDEIALKYLERETEPLN